MEAKKLLETRKKLKARKPNFIRQDFHKKVGLRKGWRRPKGLHSKLRLKVRGKIKPISQGYRSPRAVRGLNKSGLEEKNISSLNQLEGLDSKKHGIVIASSMGNKKRVELLRKVKEAGFKVFNIKNPEEFIKKVEANLKHKKKLKEEKEKKETKKKEDKKEEKLAEKVTGQEKKDAEKKEKEKLLTKRER